MAERCPLPLLQQNWGLPGKAGFMGGGKDFAIFATNFTLKLVDSITIITTMCFTYLAEHPTHPFSAAAANWGRAGLRCIYSRKNTYRHDAIND